MKVKVLDIVKDKAVINILEDLEFSIKNNNYKKGDTIKLLIRPETFEIQKEYVKNSIPGIVKDYT